MSIKNNNAYSLTMKKKNSNIDCSCVFAFSTLIKSEFNSNIVLHFSICLLIRESPLYSRKISGTSIFGNLEKLHLVLES